MFSNFLVVLSPMSLGAARNPRGAALGAIGVRAAPGMLSGATIMKCGDGTPGHAVRFALLCLCLLQPARLAAGEDEESGPRIHNPYFETTRWRVWRDRPIALAGVQSMRRAGKEKVVFEATLAPRAGKERIYPAPWPGDDPPERFLAYRPLPKPSTSAAGIWDDVYTSWSGLHGYVRSRTGAGPGRQQGGRSAIRSSTS